MTHLDILARSISDMAVRARKLEVYCGRQPPGNLAWYYRGKAVGLLLAADKVRAEAMDRVKVDKEAKE